MRNGVDASAAQHGMKGALECNGTAMQGELLRLLRICPYGVMALLADTAASGSSACETPRKRVGSGDYGAGQDDPVPSNETDGDRDRDRDPFGDLTNTTQQDDIASPAAPSTEEVKLVGRKSKHTVATSSTGVKPKKKVRPLGSGDTLLPSPIKGLEDLQASKLEGVMRGRLKFCTNLDMSEWEHQMQVIRCDFILFYLT